MSQTLDHVHLGASHPRILVGYDGSNFYTVSTDSAGRLTVVPVQYDAESMELVPIEGSASTGTEVKVMNFPALQNVTGPLTNAELRAADVPVSVAEENKAVKIYESGTDLYICKAAAVSALNAAVWQICKFDTTNLQMKWAGTAYNNLATNLATVAGLSYT